ncbi:MAG: hypothetical protein MUC80_01910 [Candidatus Thermoplasmatota archaeon]|nr:hypothetical protein [Candidatus Thermoplasmatota archaeon]
MKAADTKSILGLPWITPFPIINLITYFLGALKPPISFAEGFKATPSNITIGYNEKVTIQIGNIDLITGNFSLAFPRFFLAGRYLTFTAEYPEGYSGGLFVNFNPPVVVEEAGKYSITNVTISLNSPPRANDIIQSRTIRIRIADTWIIKNLWWPEDKAYWVGGDRWIPFATGPPFWFLAALFGGFGKNSGKILTDYYYIDVLVKVKAFHAVKIQPLTLEKLAPNEIMSIPLLVQNLGNYNDTINFRAKTENNTFLEITQDSSIALQPGEEGQVFVGVASPNNFLDTGTLHEITLEAYSSEEPNVTIATQRIALETKGVYVSEENVTFGFGAGLIFLIVVAFLFYWRRKISETIRKKPEKPWKILEEEQHLAELKQTNKHAYEQERLMMQDEYKSALLFYKDESKQYKRFGIIPSQMKKESSPSFFKKILMSLKTAVTPKQKPTKAKLVLPKKKEKKPIKQKVKSVIPASDVTKDKLLAKIRREQEKQLRKLQ